MKLLFYTRSQKYGKGPTRRYNKRNEITTEEMTERRTKMKMKSTVAKTDYGHSHGVIGRTLMETAGEHAAILYNSADGIIVCVMLLANLSFSEKKCSAERPLRIIPVIRNC